jgi:hypothetical protein
MLRGTKLALAVFVAASGLSLIGISGASAACRQQFTNTTCDWLGRNCVNHFKTVCDAPVAPPKLVIAPVKPIVTPGGGAGLVGNAGIITHDGGSLIGASGSTMKPR